MEPSNIEVVASDAFAPGVLWIVLIIFTIAFVFMSAVMHYHWSSYSPHSSGIRKTKRIYYSVALVLLVGAAFIVISL